MLENFIWLFKWYASQCDHYWEEWYGIVLETTESSGWSISICIEETEMGVRPAKLQNYGVVSGTTLGH